MLCRSMSWRVRALALVCCGLLGFGCPAEPSPSLRQAAEIPSDAVSADVALTAVVPQGDWTLSLSSSGRLPVQVREPSKGVEEVVPGCTDRCSPRDYLLHCPRGKCSFVFDLAVTREAPDWPIWLEASILLGSLEDEGCGGPDPQAVPSEDVERLFHLSFDAQNVVRAQAPAAWPGYQDDAAPEVWPGYPDPVSEPPSVRGRITDARDGRGYTTVMLGEQTWLAENLSYGEQASVDSPALPGTTSKRCLDDNPQQCRARGGLYTWSQALSLPAACVETACSPPLAGHQRGICPEGWHIPSHEEWSTLAFYLASAWGNPPTDEAAAWQVASSLLKSQFLWGAGAGLSSEGFAAIPSGTWQPGVGFTGAEVSVAFHAATAVDDNASGPQLSETGGSWQTYPRTTAISVRCLRD